MRQSPKVPNILVNALLVIIFFISSVFIVNMIIFYVTRLPSSEGTRGASAAISVVASMIFAAFYFTEVKMTERSVSEWMTYFRLIAEDLDDEHDKD